MRATALTDRRILAAVNWDADIPTADDIGMAFFARTGASEYELLGISDRLVRMHLWYMYLPD